MSVEKPLFQRKQALLVRQALTDTLQREIYSLSEIVQLVQVRKFEGFFKEIMNGKIILSQ